MNLYFFDDERIITFVLPVKKIGNFWLKDSRDRNIINIEAKNNDWYISCSKICSIKNAENDCCINLKAKQFYTLIIDDREYCLFSNYLNDNSFSYYNIKDNSTITIGNNNSNIAINFEKITEKYASLNYVNAKWTLNIEDGSSCYINDMKVLKKSVACNNCDLINIFGIKILLAAGYIFVNNPINNVSVNNLESFSISVDKNMTNDEIDDVNLYKDDDYFLKSPRIRKNITTFEMSIDSPPQKEEIADTPLWVTLAPMLTMAASSTITLSNTIMSIVDGEKTFKSCLPSLIICVSMLFTMLIWPFIMRKLDKKNKIKKEGERQQLYQNYINSKDKEIVSEYENQKHILEDNIIPIEACYDIIINRRRILWSRRIDQDDFLTLRVGKGDVPFDAHINYHAEDFSMDNDNLKDMVNKIVNYSKIITDVPVSYSFSDNILTGINGIYTKYFDFTDNLLVQAMAFHSYDDLKIVILTNENNKNRWNYLLDSPYCFSNDKSIRFFATNADEMQELSNYLEQIFAGRQSVKKNDSGYSEYNCYYLIITDDIDLSRKLGIIDYILNEKRNMGFSLVVLEEKLSKVPSEVSKFIIIGDKTSTILDTNNNDQVKFTLEINDTFDMNACTKILANIPVPIESNEKQLPNSISFLELFGVGKIEQLNILNRWKDNNPTKSLKAEIGVNTLGEPFVLDLHEKQHGPHGLIAGMTGSGKSEFIISYILSMALNYSPEEVAFVLIDYKGGGLANAFVDSDTGNKLPHVVGTITNLDKTEINRALASINSELRRRQEIFNEVKVKVGEGTIDIYKYQKLYRDGVLDEPMPHLIIVSDEFAELKSQHPEFMNDLVSTARIGRSLGVHLILATQKPSGVVDGQIWSNARFKVSLKVQDKQDSMEVIKNDLAAELKNVGRFYLLIGYNEYFAMGQAAWAGAQYYPNSEYKKSVDKNLYMIDNIGGVSKSILNTISKRNVNSEGDELTNIVKYIIDIGKSTPLKIKQLWLDKLPSKIYLNQIIDKYKYEYKKYYINPVIGEYDNPINQQQNILTLNLTEDGNTIIYGMNESGKDEFLQTLCYSLLNNYSTDELNLYIMDFGAETLINFKDCPQVGNVIVNGDDERVNNIVKLLSTEMLKRKKIFINYGGSYEKFIESSSEKLPNIVVVINSIEIVTELYPDVIDKLVPIVRDCNKYGIYFVITTENTSSIKMKISQSCKNFLCLQLSNDLSYRDVLGKVGDTLPSQILGRGLVKKENVCEFQTAYISEELNSYESIKKFATEVCSRGYKKAVSIQVMPDVITLSSFNMIYKDLSSVPIGIIKESLNVSLYNFMKKVCTIISTNEIENLKVVLNNLPYILSKNNKFKFHVIDAMNYYDNFKFECSYIKDKYNEFVDSVKALDDKYQEILSANNMNSRCLDNYGNNAIMIIGIEKFLNKLDDDHKKIFKAILDHNRETPKINFIFVDIPMSFKKYEYEEWYKNNFDTSNGFWVGPGFGQQFVLKSTIQLSALSNIDNNHVIVDRNGIPTVVKVINEIK